nr:unnamed protein product [Callosobruchus analis]
MDNSPLNLAHSSMKRTVSAGVEDDSGGEILFWMYSKDKLENLSCRIEVLNQLLILLIAEKLLSHEDELIGIEAVSLIALNKLRKLSCLTIFFNSFFILEVMKFLFTGKFWCSRLSKLLATVISVSSNAVSTPSIS